MGKLLQKQLPVVRQQQQQQQRRTDGIVDSRIFCCRRCSTSLSRIVREFNCKCVIVLLLSVAVFISALFSVVHLHSMEIGYDAKEKIKLSATVQAYLTLQRPVAQLVPHINELEYDIFEEIGVPSTKVMILSMHKAGVSNVTDVVFGILPDQLNISINPVFLSLLKLSFIELFLQQSNLTLTNTTFGQPSSFEILRFAGGITLIPEQSPSILKIPKTLFSFTLNNSIYEIKQNIVELKTQMKLGLHLLPDEIVYIQVTNNNGSTRDPPITVEASVTSNLGILLPQRMRQLAELLTGPSAKNLGLDAYVFGKVKEVSLSSSLKRSLHALQPSPSPSPSPSPAPASPFYESDPSAPVPNFHHLAPCSNCDTYAPSDSSHANGPNPENDYHTSPSKMPSSPAPSPVDINLKCDSGSPSPSPISHIYPPSASISLPLLPCVSDRCQDNKNGRLPLVSASSSYIAVGSLHNICWICVFGLFICHLLSCTF
ncbi:hypothetical protein ACH5RR_001927 [Cinchona calisaya]|uniref:DUF7036 domain-containing protein n=1 Tax=Cinchona calisaya TaxID=153742 RepID=A0ABD3B530_9GENT